MEEYSMRLGVDDAILFAKRSLSVVLYED